MQYHKYLKIRFFMPGAKEATMLQRPRPRPRVQETCFLAAFPYLDGAAQALLHPEAPSTVIQGRQERTVR